MDVDREQFRKELLPILRNIAKADFVTFDLEMSGISTRPKFSSGDRGHNVGKPTLEQQYQELKSAAEAFQVLQIGITCVEADREKEFYLARPYNFNLTPLSADAAEEKKVGDLRLERVFSFSSSAAGFLHGKKFDFGKVFTHGVPYLSRDEEAGCREEYNLRANVLAKQPSVQIRLDDQKTLEFYRRARRTIHDWLKSPTPKDPWINIGNPDGPLNPFQRLLVHQLIREEFPTLKCFGKNDGAFMQVEVLDHKKEAKYQAKKLIGHNDKIAKQKGLSFIFEALVGGDLSGIQPEWFASNSSDKAEHQLPYIKAELAQIVETLQKKKHVLVGHNVFMDLGFLYKTFIGNLPATVKNFQAEIHDLFPTVFDTKYLATHDNSSMNPRVNLKDHLAPFRKVHVPLIVLHEQHTAYGASVGKEHEAGFDSWMTAELFVKLSAKLYSTSKTSRSVETMTQLDCISDTDSTFPSIYGSTLNVRCNMSSERLPSESAHLSVPNEKAMDYYSDDDDDSPDGGALIDLRSATSSPKKTDARLDALNSGFSHVEPFLPTTFQAQSKTNTRLGPLIDGSAHARSVYGGSVNADLLPGLAMSSQAQIDANTYSGSSSTFPGLPIGSRSACIGTFRSSNFKNGSRSAPSTDSYSTIATGADAGGGGALVNAHDHLGSAIIRAPVPWQVAASKRASLSSGQGTTHFAPTSMQDNLPSSYHARQVDSSAVTIPDNDVEVEAANNEALVQQWIPHYNHPFWRPYANKLRVYAVEGGVCKLT